MPSSTPENIQSTISVVPFLLLPGLGPVGAPAASDTLCVTPAAASTCCTSLYRIYKQLTITEAEGGNNCEVKVPPIFTPAGTLRERSRPDSADGNHRDLKTFGMVKRKTTQKKEKRKEKQTIMDSGQPSPWREGQRKRARKSFSLNTKTVAKYKMLQRGGREHTGAKVWLTSAAQDHVLMTYDQQTVENLLTNDMTAVIMQPPLSSSPTYSPKVATIILVLDYFQDLVILKHNQNIRNAKTI